MHDHRYLDHPSATMDTPERSSKQTSSFRRCRSPSITAAFANHPLHYMYALTLSRCAVLNVGYETLDDQLEVERDCLERYSGLFPNLAPHPSIGQSQPTSPSNESGETKQCMGDGGQSEYVGGLGAARCEENDDGLPIEDEDFLWKHAIDRIQLQRSRHVAFLSRGLQVGYTLGMGELAAQRPWLLYWMVHGLALLDAFSPEEHAERYCLPGRRFVLPIIFDEA